MGKTQDHTDPQQLRILRRAFEIADDNARRLEAVARSEEQRAATAEGQLRAAEMRWQNYANDRATRRGQAARAERAAREKIATADTKIAALSEAVDSAATPRQWAEAQGAVLDAEYQRAMSQADLDKAVATLALEQAREDLHVLAVARLREEIHPAKEKAGPARRAADEAHQRADSIAAEIARVEAESDAAELAMAERLALGLGAGPRAEA